MRGALLALVLALGCDGGAPGCPPAALDPLERAPAHVVLTSDYGSSALALLDADGVLLSEAWMDSGTHPPGLVAALSGDVVLPSHPAHLGPCEVVLIDRFGTDVLTFLDPCASDPARVTLAQVDARGAGQAEGAAAYRANPQDILPVGDLYYVSRFEPNLDSAAPLLSLGNDLLLLDRGSRAPVGRIDLSVFDQPSEAETPRRFARPSGLALVTRGAERRLLVALSRLSLDFRSAGTGAIALVDPNGARPEVFELPGLANCGRIHEVPDDPSRALVTCAGDPFLDPEGRRARAGLALVELTAAGTLELVRRLVAADHPDQPALDGGGLPLGGSLAFVVSMGDLSLGIDDRALLVDLASATFTLLFEAEDAFVLGAASFDPVSRRLLVPDAARNVLRSFTLGASSSDAEPGIDPSPCRGLPPRQVRALARP